MTRGRLLSSLRVNTKSRGIGLKLHFQSTVGREI